MDDVGNDNSTDDHQAGENEKASTTPVKEKLFENVFATTINSPTFSEYLAPIWNEDSESVSEEVTGDSTWRIKGTSENKMSHLTPVEESESGYVIFDEKSQSYISITELVSYELEAYVNRYLSAFVSSFRECISLSDASEASALQLDVVTAKLHALISEAIHKDASKNSQYCKKLVKWLSSKANTSGSEDDPTPPQSDEYSLGGQGRGEELSNKISIVNEVCDEYMKYAPGPWRECVLIEAFKGYFLPELQSTVLKQLTQIQAQAQAQTQSPALNTPRKREGDVGLGVARPRGGSARKQKTPPPTSSPDERNKSESTEIEDVSLSVSEGDDYSDSVSSIGGDHYFDQTISVSLNNSFSEHSGGRETSSTRNKRLMMMAGSGGGSRGAGHGSGRHHALHKYKAEIYMLQNQLEAAEAVDKTMLQDRIREYQLDVNSLRDRNSELREQLSELNMKVFEMMRASKGDKALSHANHPALSSPVERSVDSADDDDDAFEDAVLNVEDAYAIDTKKKSRIGNKAKVLSEDEETNTGTQLEEQEDEDNQGRGGGSSHSDALPLRQDGSEEHRLQELISLYEKQFDIMKAEIRYLRMTEKRPLPSRGGHGSGGGDGRTALSETALRVVAATEGAKLEGLPLAETLTNHTVSFASTSNTIPVPVDKVENLGAQVDNEATKGNSTGTPQEVANESSTGHRKPPLSDSVSSGAEQTTPGQQQTAQVHESLSLKQKRYIDKMIQRGIEAGKDIDKRTIKSLSEEVELLTAQLMKSTAAASSTSPDDDGDGVTPSPADEQKKQQKIAEHNYKAEVQRLRSSLEKAREAQQSYSAYQIQLLYSFLFGGMVVLIMSSFVTWMFGVLFE